jgi:glycosyltransferase involved in cell wall biosynthesis
MAWRIDFLATAPPQDQTSGLSRAVWSLAAALVARGHSARVLFPSTNLAARPDFQGVTAIPVPDPGDRRRPFGRDIAIGRNASDLLDPEADIVVGNDEKAGALEWRKRPNGRPVFAMIVHDVSVHTFDTLRPLQPSSGLRQKVGDWLDRRALKRLETNAYGRARVILVPSEVNRELLRQHYGIADGRVQLMPVGVADPIDAGTKSEARLALKLPPDIPVVSFIGRTPERQGLPTVLETFRRVRVLFPGVRLLLVGCQAPSEPGVQALGVVDELTKGRVLRASDVFLFPTRYEGFGLAPREAMRYGVPVVVSRHVPLEGIDAKNAVRIVASDDAGDYAAELAGLLADPPMRRTMGEAGRRYADGFSYARMAELFERYLGPALA